MGMLKLVDEEWSMVVLHDNSNFSRLIVFYQQIVESKYNKNNRQMERVRPDEYGQTRLKRYSLSNILPTLLGLTKRKVVALHFLSLLKPNVERRTMESA